MKISTSLEHGKKIDGLNARESAEQMKRVGFDGVDLALCHDMDDPAKIMKKEWAQRVLDDCDAIREAGLEIAQCHLPYYPGHIDLPGDGTCRGYAEAWLESMLRSLELAGQVGAPIAVVHPVTVMGDPEGTREGNIEWIKKLVPVLEKYDMKLAVENVFSRRNAKYVDGYCGKAEEILAMVEGVNSERVGVCLDTGHANVFKYNMSKMARAFGDRLIALHVNGNAGGDSHVIPYSISGWTEQMNYHEFSETLKEIGFKGYYNLELGPGNLPRGCAQPYLELAAVVARAMADLAE